MLNKLLAFGKDVVTENQISVLSPYRAQCHIIEKELAASGISKVSVTSIVKSQGMFFLRRGGGGGGSGRWGYMDHQLESTVSSVSRVALSG